MAEPVKPFALSSVEAACASAPEAKARAAQLWIAVSLSVLPLHAADPRARLDPRPTIVVEPLQGRLRVVAVNDAARSRGIGAGFDLSAAFGFSGALRVLERSRHAETTLLEACAASCQRFTPVVSLELPESLLLEVRASLNLFGGLEHIKSALARETTEQGFESVISVAPTPLAALWLGRSGGGDALTPPELTHRLQGLPIRATRWPGTVQSLLEGIGVATVGECLRLPRGGLARRIGERYLEELDKALGRRPDLRAGFKAPRHLHFEIELAHESTSVSVFVEAVTRMTESLGEALCARQAQVRQMQLGFKHLRQAPSLYRLELLEASCDRQRLFELLRDKLERLTLPAPAAALRLEAGPLEPARLQAGPLFVDGGHQHGGEEAKLRLVERLRGRLGVEAVHALVPAADHRPERAWTRASLDGAARGSRSGALRDERAVLHPWAGERPLWLSPSPVRLPSAGGELRLDGGLHRLDGPERIESGWWDGEGVSRDYFTAVTRRGERLWVYRDRADGRWYLHGVFG